MPAHKIYDTPHESMTIKSWKRCGLKLREGETYKIIYEKVQNTTQCELCNVELTTGRGTDGRCMDHDHETGYFRYVLCKSCNNRCDTEPQSNNKTGHRWISPAKSKQKSGKYSISFQYQRKGFKQKTSQSLTKLIALSFINLLKKPI